MRKQGSARRESSRPANLSPEENRRRTFQRAVKLLAVKPRSVAELRERLLQSSGTTVAVVEAVLDRLSEYGYLDDERYAFGYASLKVRQNPIGRQRLKRELIEKKVEREVTDKALDLVFGETSEESLIELAIEKQIRLRGRPQTREAARKLFIHLLRRGFSFELVSEKVQAVARIDSENAY